MKSVSKKGNSLHTYLRLSLASVCYCSMLSPSVCIHPYHSSLEEIHSCQRICFHQAIQSTWQSNAFQVDHGSVFAIIAEGYVSTIGNLSLGNTPFMTGARTGLYIEACHNSCVICIFKHLETDLIPRVYYHQSPNDFGILHIRLNSKPLVFFCTLYS